MRKSGSSAKERFDAQRRAAGLTDDPMWFVYVLELKPDSEGVTKFYVGHTCRLQRRIHDHMCGNSVAWVRRWGVSSVIQCIRTTEESALGLEVAKTTELKANNSSKVVLKKLNKGFYDTWQVIENILKDNNLNKKELEKMKELDIATSKILLRAEL